jgi:hypothetical protein
LPEAKAGLSNFYHLTPYEQRCLTFAVAWQRRLKVNRLWSNENRETSAFDQAHRQKFLYLIADASGVAPSLANPEELTADLCRANGRRKKAGVLTLEDTLELGLALFPAVNNEVLITFAPPTRYQRPVRQVTCAVLMKTFDEKVLGYATVLPKWHPLLAGTISQGLEIHEIECFFPEAYQRWCDYQSRLRSQAFADDDPPEEPLVTTLNLA